MLRNNNAIEVLNICMSACANYLFLAASEKILNRTSLVVYHGGPRQANVRAQIESAIDSVVEGRKSSRGVGRLNYEMVIVEDSLSRQIEWMQKRSSCPNEGDIENSLGRCMPLSADIYLNQITRTEQQYFQDISPLLDKNIPYYGQWGEYESVYQSYQYFGFYYDIDTLQKMGVNNIQVQGGEWVPEANPFIRSVYKVELD
jgi:hypothetical protein